MDRSIDATKGGFLIEVYVFSVRLRDRSQGRLRRGVRRHGLLRRRLHGRRPRLRLRRRTGKEAAELIANLTTFGLSKSKEVVKF